jgi:hypothetical protein
MNLIHEGKSLQVEFYAMPRRGKPMTLVVNGETCEASWTSWGKYRNTYWLFRNVPMFVHTHLPDGAAVRLEGIPDNFGAPEKPGVRKSYYMEKKSKADPQPEAVEPADA